MSWAGLANNQTVSLDNLIDAVANGVFIQQTTIPSGIKEITKLEAQTYVCLDTSYAPFAAKTNNQLVVKSDLVACAVVTTTSTTTTTTFSGTTTTSTTTTTTAAPTTSTTTSTTTIAETTTTSTTSTTSTFATCECHDGLITDNNSFSYYDCFGGLVTGGAESGSVICFDINRPRTGNIQDNGVSGTCTCQSTTTTTTSSTTSTTTLPFIACGNLTIAQGGISYPSTQQVGLGATTGTVTLAYDMQDVPDRMIVIWNTNVVIDTGYRGNANYNYGGSLRTTFTSSLSGLVDPTGGGQTYPYSSPGNAPDGYPYVLQPGSGNATFNKNSGAPTSASVRVYAPIDGTVWSYILSCPV